MNRPEVKAALHVNDDIKWTECSMVVKVRPVGPQRGGCRPLPPPNSPPSSPLLAPLQYSEADMAVPMEVGKRAPGPTTPWDWAERQ
jgi:hypothetical protein